MRKLTPTQERVLARMEPGIGYAFTADGLKCSTATLEALGNAKLIYPQPDRRGVRNRRTDIYWRLAIKKEAGDA